MIIEIKVAEYGEQSTIAVDGKIKLTYKEWNKEKWRSRYNAWKNLEHILERLHIEDMGNE